MKLYAILSDPNNEALVRAIEEHFPDNHYDFDDGQWFIAGKGTATAVYAKLAGDEDAEDIGTVVVLSIGGYYGLASSNLWDWMSSRDD